MFYVYVLRSIAYKTQKYVGYTSDLKRRIQEHNFADSIHTSKFEPWELESYFAFSDQTKAEQFEQYLKSGSGRAFAEKHL
jgi:predicted GIY-YIG superfamily endonuclease